MSGSFAGRWRWILWHAVAAMVMLIPFGPQAWNWASDYSPPESSLLKEGESKQASRCHECEREKSSKENNSAFTSGWCPCEPNPPSKLCFVAVQEGGTPVTISYPTPLENNPPDLDFDGTDTWEDGYFRVVDGSDTYDVKFDMQGDMTCEIGDWSLLMEVTKNGTPFTPYATAGWYTCDPLTLNFEEALLLNLSGGSIKVTVFECP